MSASLFLLTTHRATDLAHLYVDLLYNFLYTYHAAKHLLFLTEI